jgi:hypothetical protein
MHPRAPFPWHWLGHWLVPWLRTRILLAQHWGADRTQWAEHRSSGPQAETNSCCDSWARQAESRGAVKRGLWRCWMHWCTWIPTEQRHLQFVIRVSVCPSVRPADPRPSIVRPMCLSVRPSRRPPLPPAHLLEVLVAGSRVEAGRGAGVGVLARHGAARVDPRHRRRRRGRCRGAGGARAVGRRRRRRRGRNAAARRAHHLRKAHAVTHPCRPGRLRAAKAWQKLRKTHAVTHPCRPRRLRAAKAWQNAAQGSPNIGGQRPGKVRRASPTITQRPARHLAAVRGCASPVAIIDCSTWTQRAPHIISVSTLKAFEQQQVTASHGRRSRKPYRTCSKDSKPGQTPEKTVQDGRTSTAGSGSEAASAGGASSVMPSLKLSVPTAITPSEISAAKWVAAFPSPTTESASTSALTLPPEASARLSMLLTPSASPLPPSATEPSMDAKLLSAASAGLVGQAAEQLLPGFAGRGPGASDGNADMSLSSGAACCLLPCRQTDPNLVSVRCLVRAVAGWGVGRRVAQGSERPRVGRAHNRGHRSALSPGAPSLECMGKSWSFLANTIGHSGCYASDGWLGASEGGGNRQTDPNIAPCIAWCMPGRDRQSPAGHTDGQSKTVRQTDKHWTCSTDIGPAPQTRWQT